METLRELIDRAARDVGTKAELARIRTGPRYPPRFPYARPPDRDALQQAVNNATTRGTDLRRAPGAAGAAPGTACMVGVRVGPVEQN